MPTEEVTRDSSGEPSPPSAIAGWAVWRVLAGLILLAAAGLKAQQLATTPVSVVAAASGFGEGLLSSGPILTGLVVAEFLFAGWLLTMWAPALTRWLAGGLFTIFAVFTLGRALDGDASCGCFGSFTVNPWITFGLDVVLAAGFFWLRPHLGSAASRRRARAASIAVAVASVGLAAAAAGWIITADAPASLDAGGDLLGDGAFVILEPEAWVGQPCPLLTYIDTNADLAVGEQTLVLYSYNCGHCIESIPGYEARARAGESVVLVSMPPHAGSGQSPVAPDSPCSTARLSDAREWFVQTPAEIRLQDGRVVFAQQQASP